MEEGIYIILDCFAIARNDEAAFESPSVLLTLASSPSREQNL